LRSILTAAFLQPRQEGFFHVQCRGYDELGELVPTQPFLIVLSNTCLGDRRWEVLMAERSGTTRIVRTVVGLIALGAIAVVGAIVARPYLRAGPATVARQFLAAVGRQDWEAARELMTSETRTTDAKNLQRVLSKGSTFSVGEANQRGTFAAVEFTVPDGAPGQVLLQQRDGQWLVYGDAQGAFMAPEDESTGDGAPN
jgi:hypothetical protein